MHIAMVFDGLPIGGIERVGAAYARLLRELGHEVTVLNLDPARTQFETEFPSDVPIEHVSFPRRRAPEYHINLIRGGFLQKAACPFVYGAHRCACAVSRALPRRNPALRRTYDLAVAFSGHFNDLAFVAHGLVRARNTVCWLHGALYQYLLLSDGYRALYRRIRNLVVLVDDGQEEVFAYDSSLRLNIRKLYNPSFIGSAATEPSVVEELRSRYGPFLLMVARMSYPHKDHYTVLRALKLLRERYGDDLNLVFVGSGPDEEKLRDFTRSLGEDAAARVHFLGDRYDAQNFFAAARLLVHASVAGEGLPTVMLEALAFRLPMVVTDSRVGPREILGDSEYGLLCRVQDPADMAEKIHRLHTDETLYRTYQERSDARFADFTPDAARARLAALLAELEGGPSARS